MAIVPFPVNKRPGVRIVKSSEHPGMWEVQAIEQGQWMRKTIRDTREEAKQACEDV